MSNELSKIEWTESKIELIKNLYCKNATNDEFELFSSICKQRGLDPTLGQIYFIKYGSKMTIITSIDGLRLIADRSGRYAPGKESTYAYDKDGRLRSATSYVKKQTIDGTWHEIGCTAQYEEYMPDKSSTWGKMPHIMLAKCAEALALRKSFPAEMSGLYVKEEMDQAATVEIEPPNLTKHATDEQWNQIDAFLNEDPTAEPKLVELLKGKSLSQLYESKVSEAEADRAILWLKRRQEARVAKTLEAKATHETF